MIPAWNLRALPSRPLPRGLIHDGVGTLTIPLPGKVVLDVHFRPGEWMSDAELSRLGQDLRRIATRASHNGEAPAYGALTGQRRELSSRVIVVAYRGDRRIPAAFSAMAFVPIEVGTKRDELVHLGLVAVDREHGGRSLVLPIYVLPLCIHLLLRGFEPYFISSTTQSPAIFGWVSSTFSAVYPSERPGAEQREFHRALAAQVFRARAVFGTGAGASLDLERQVVRGAFTGNKLALKKSFAEVRKSRDTAVNEFCENLLDYERGDEVLQIGKVDLQGVRTLSANKLRKLGPLGPAIAHLGTASLAVMVAPMVRAALGVMRNRQRASLAKPGREARWIGHRYV